MDSHSSSQRRARVRALAEEEEAEREERGRGEEAQVTFEVTIRPYMYCPARTECIRRRSWKRRAVGAVNGGSALPPPPPMVSLPRQIEDPWYMVPWRREPGAEQRLRELFRRVVQLDGAGPQSGALTKQQLVERLRAVRGAPPARVPSTVVNNGACARVLRSCAWCVCRPGRGAARGHAYPCGRRAGGCGGGLGGDRASRRRADIARWKR
jgi:hypothetical protein